MTKRVAMYLRVSTNEQTVENQRRELNAVIEHMGWHICAVYEDAGISGAKGRDQRPDFDQMCKDAARRRFDMVMSWSVDRLGRSLQDLVAFLNDLDAIGIDLYLHQQGIDTATPTGKAMFQMLGVFSEFERSMIRERVLSGLARAKAQGKRLGRPKVEGSVENQIRHLRAIGYGVRRTARTAGCGVSVVQRVILGS